MHRERLFLAAAIAGSLLAAWNLSAGLRFEKLPGPNGADVASLAGDGTRLFAATPHGIWRLDAGRWTLDGLHERSVAAVAVSGGTLFAVDGTSVYRRVGESVYVVETLPSTLPLPSVLASSGDTLYAAGLGVFRRSGGTWSALPSPGTGFILAAAVTESGDVAVGFGSGVVARFSGGVWTSFSSGIGTGEPISALVSSGGSLYAGTSRGLYGLSGVTWVRDAAFGAHDVRALTAAQGTLRAATADAGVFRKSGSSWVPESGAFLTLSTRSFGVLGSELHAGTAGGPVYRLLGGSWIDASSGLDAATISELRADPTGALVTSRGAGALHVTPAGETQAWAVPPGCGVLVGAGREGSADSSALVVVGNPCGRIDASAHASTQGLPAGAVLTSFSDLGTGGTSGFGAFQAFGGTWSEKNGGLVPNTALVQTVRSVAGAEYAGVGAFVGAWDGLARAWIDRSAGLPQTGLVLSLGGDERALYAGLSAGGVYRREPGSIFRRDAAGLATASVFSLDRSALGTIAAAGVSGSRVKRDGGWVPETSGLPPAADVRVVRGWSSGGVAVRHGIFAGTAGSGVFFAAADPSVRAVPVVLDVVGGTGARYRTELTFGNPTGAAVTLHVTFSPSPGFGAPAIATGTVTKTLAAGAELRASDALDFLRAGGLPIPPATLSSPIAGSLSISADAGGVAGAATDAVYAIARTYTTDAAGGTYGLFYDAPSDLESAEDEASIYGLRSVAGISRSNLALVHLPGRGEAPITLEVQVYRADGAAAGAAIPVILQPAEWRQLNGVLALAGLPEGSFGYARIVRRSGIGAWTAYGVVNDAKTSDGSFLPLFRPGGLSAARRLVVPVVLDVYGAAGSHFTTELTLANDSSIATPADLFYQPAPGAGTAPGLPYVTVSLGARQQLTIPDVIQYLREHGIDVPDAATGAQVGTLEINFRFLTNLDAPKTVALARTSTPNPSASIGGAFGLFYSAAARGSGARTAALIPALTEDASVRSNLAVVHLGGGSELPMTLSVQLHDAATGAPVGNALSVTLAPGDWYQFSRVLEVAGALGRTTRAYAVVTRVAGDDTFYAYGVLNDAITSDGSFLKMIPSDRD